VAFADGDYELARTLKLKDRELDALTDDVIERLVERAGHESESVPSYLDLIFVARAFERVVSSSAKSDAESDTK
jgi:phosphate uptake regulator